MAYYDDFSAARMPGGSLWDLYGFNQSGPSPGGAAGIGPWNTGRTEPYPGAEGTPTWTQQATTNNERTGGYYDYSQGREAVWVPFSNRSDPNLQRPPAADARYDHPIQSTFGLTMPGAKWRQTANKEYGQGLAALSAYDKLYAPTLALAQRSAMDYGDLYRRAANESLAHNIYSTGLTREADLADYFRLGPALLDARRTADPLFGASYNLAGQDLAEVNAPLPANVARDISENVRGSQARRGMGLGGSDAFEEALRLTMSGEEFRNQRRDRAFRQAGSLLSVYGDPFQALTGRQARSAAPQGAEVMAPYAGFDSSTLLSYGVNNELQNQNIDLAKRGQSMQLTGAIVGGVLGAAGNMAKGACWVAREVYGVDNPRWRQFRSWLIARAPLTLLRRYLRHGERFAGWLREHPEHKARVRAWMENKLSSEVAYA